MCVCVWSQVHLQPCMLGEDYFQFSDWREANTLPGLRCWLAGLLSPAPASHLSLAASLHGWPAGMENQTLMGTRVFQWEGELKSSQEGQHALTDRA